MNHKTEASTALEQAIEKDPDNSEAYKMVVALQYEEGNIDNALSHARQMAEAKPDDSGALMQLGSLASEAGETDEALQAYSTILEQKPDFVLILPWNIQDEILLQQAEYRRRGGRFIVPIPSPIVL